MGWFKKRPPKKYAKQIHKGRLNRQLNKQLEAAGVNVDNAFCTTCGRWYDITNNAAYEWHRHLDD